MEITRTFFISLLLLLLSATGFSQNPTQNVRGTVLDQQSETPLIGVSVELLGAAETTGTVTDMDGFFEINNVPVGRQAFRFSYLGYEQVTIPNVVVTAGKEVSLDVKMSESLLELAEVVVVGTVDKDRAGNELATISARQFSLEEVTRYSGARNDAARMAANFAGVNINNDSRNDIVVRGNSPTGLLWRLEGVPIPNPNHYSTLGTTGGPVSALNTNLLKNSDFLTSAFPAEYGNALSGVFDIGFRSGNKEHFETTLQLAAFSGLEAMVEGPLKKENNSSFLLAYRHSFVELAESAGLNVGTAATPKYKDLSFKIDLPKSKLGNLSFFGIGGLSNIDFLGNELADDDFFAETDQNSYVTSKLGVVGLNHRKLLNQTAYIRTTLSASTSSNTYKEELIREDATNRQHIDLDEGINRYALASYFNKKYNARHTLRVGFLGEIYNSFSTLLDRETTPDWITVRDFDENMLLLQAYAQTQYRLNEKWTLNGGLHAQFLTFNDTWAVEPRAAVNFHPTPRQTISIGYGLHNQMQPLPMYFYLSRLADGSYVRSNEDLDFTESNQFVLGYDLKIGSNWRVKAETYYQAISDVPVESVPGTFSMLNAGADFVFPEEGFLVNNGSGKNYGLELTVEKFFSNNYYVLMTGSVFESKYTASDGIERNTAFNNNYTFNLLAGREFPLGKSGRNALTFDTKFTTAGGRYFTPVDLQASIATGEQVLKDELAFTEQFDPYLRWDVKIGFRTNSKKRKLSQQFFMDFQNVTNRENIFVYRYNRQKGEVQRSNQIGFFPDILWRVQF
ncbi:MAG TPA: TonB-dependent receptor [Bacteroidetes bacterium]|nr:TonB-dependent receptor [Bacteroidota bacterium]